MNDSQKQKLLYVEVAGVIHCRIILNKYCNIERALKLHQYIIIYTRFTHSPLMNTSHVLKHDGGKYVILSVKEKFVCILECSRHDALILGESRVMAELEQHAFAADGTPLCIYGDSA